MMVEMVVIMVVSVIMFVVMAILVMVMVVVVVVVMMVVSVVVMVVVVGDLLLSVDADGEVRRRDAAAGDRLADEFNARDVKGVQFVECGLWVGLEFEKCGGEHVSCGPH